MQIAEMRKDFNSLVHNSLFTMEVEDRVRLLAAVGQAPLAYLVAKTHGLTDDCARIQQMLGVWHAECRVMPGLGQCLMPVIVAVWRRRD
jgi:coatomer protein complex subunit alpha (xenin)